MQSQTGSGIRGAMNRPDVILDQLIAPHASSLHHSTLSSNIITIILFLWRCYIQLNVALLHWFVSFLLKSTTSFTPLHKISTTRGQHFTCPTTS
jgi:hypothetical protein